MKKIVIFALALTVFAGVTASFATVPNGKGRGRIYKRNLLKNLKNNEDVQNFMQDNVRKKGNLFKLRRRGMTQVDPPELQLD